MVHCLEVLAKLNESAANTADSASSISLVVVNDCDYSQCLYINGKVWKHTGEHTVNASDLADAAAGQTIDLRMLDIDCVHEEWPELLEDVLGP
ncbi:hypothetical protein [Roseimaritima ulvae]|uniref:Uncharacterized protein n=1 Tax=Roseimaritima ulvae TaxID=980254 RepID=A0A5B9QR80_9BACT|nr:hypothetical protein [Roseimaritima ulvae]QEG40452.1 hypothetical protein UC8_24640 [Roseimaritima ulvae]